MPDGVFVQFPQALPGPSIPDLEVPLDPVTTWAEGPITPSSIASGAASWSEVVPLANPALGSWAPEFDRQWFERLHVIPRLADLGAVLSDQSLDVEVWNAFRSRAKNLEEITVSGPAGVSVANPYGLPTHFASSRSRLYVVTVSGEGDPAIDNLIVWVFSGVDTSGTDLRLLGFRVLPWPFEINMAGGGIRETYGYLTNVLRSRDGTEQRIQLRAVAIGELTIPNLFDDARQVQFANSLLYGNQARAWGVPLWQFRNPLLAAASAGETVLQVNTSFIPWHVDDLVFIWRSPFSWEVQRVAEVHPTSLDLTLELNGSWAVPGTHIIPLVVGRLSTSESLNWEALKIGAVDLTFDLEGFFV